MAEAGQGILRRKVAAARAEASEGGPGADRGWRLALARAARDKLKITLDFKTMTIDKRSLAELVEMPPDRALIAILDGPDEGLGVIMLSAPILTGFIEAQTIGKVKTTELSPRKPTRTDAAMVANIIDAALRGLEAALADEADLVWAGGFRYASFLDDPRPLGLLLEDTTYKVLRGQVDLASGARTGEVLLAFPAEGRGQGPVAKLDAVEPQDHTHVFMEALAERVNGSHCRLDAVLARVTLPLSEVLALSEGALLPLTQAALDQISLEGFDGRRVAEGKLGQNRGMRAIRLTEGAQMSGAMGDASVRSGGDGFAAPMDLGGMGGELGGMGDDMGFPAMDLGDMMLQATGTD